MSAMGHGDDPGEFTVAEVREYLGGPPATVTADEFDRVLAAERDGKARQGILGAYEGDGEPGVLPAGAEVVSEAPSGQWKALLDDAGRPVKVSGSLVRVP
jgi:hypothetical protein